MKTVLVTRTMVTIIGAAILFALTSEPARACSNFVGGVCLDAPQKKSTPTRKKRSSTRKKAVTVQPAKPARKAAKACADERTVKGSKLYDGRVAFRYNVRNVCNESIVVFFQVDTCTKPAGYMGWNYKEGERRAFTLRAGQSKAVNYWASPSHTDPGASSLRAHHYADQAKRNDRSKFPKSC